MEKEGNVGRIIAIANQKGGVGKTTTAINLAACLAEAGQKILIIDIDPQGNTTSGFGLSKTDIEKTVYEVLLRECDIKEAIQEQVIENLDILPSNVNLAGAEIDLIDVENREYTLKESISEIRDRYDYILIDCPPALGVLTTNALAASDSVLIPVQCEYYSLEGVTQLLNTILLTQSKKNPKLDIEGVLLTMLDGRTLVGLEVVEDVRKFFKEKVFNTIIPRLVRLVEAPSHGKPILEYDPKCRGALAYINLAKEVIERNGKQEESTREGARTTI